MQSFRKINNKDIKLDFVIIGAQKSASTFIHACLIDHPEVFIPNNEISIFEDPDYEKDNLTEILLNLLIKLKLLY